MSWVSPRSEGDPKWFWVDVHSRLFVVTYCTTLVLFAFSIQVKMSAPLHQGEKVTAGGDASRHDVPSEASNDAAATTGEHYTRRGFVYLDRIKADYTYAIAQFEDECVPIPTSWFYFSHEDGWGAYYPFETYKAQRYVDLIHILTPEQLDKVPFRKYRITRAPRQVECAKCE